MKYYSAHNHYASDCSIGFANTWHVFVWESRKARDTYLAGCQDLASRPIKKREIGKYLRQPRPFTWEAYRLDPTAAWGDDAPAGLLGHVEVTADPWDKIF